MSNIKSIKAVRGFGVRVEFEDSSDIEYWHAPDPLSCLASPTYTRHCKFKKRKDGKYDEVTSSFFITGTNHPTYMTVNAPRKAFENTLADNPQYDEIASDGYVGFNFEIASWTVSYDVGTQNEVSHTSDILKECFENIFQNTKV